MKHILKAMEPWQDGGQHGAALARAVEGLDVGARVKILRQAAQAAEEDARERIDELREIVAGRDALPVE